MLVAVRIIHLVLQWFEVYWFRVQMNSITIVQRFGFDMTAIAFRYETLASSEIKKKKLFFFHMKYHSKIKTKVSALKYFEINICHQRLTIHQKSRIYQQPMKQRMYSTIQVYITSIYTHCN